MMFSRKIVWLTLIFLAGCTSTSVTKTSASSVLINTSAAPICGSGGAMRVAEKQAAIATLRQGFDRYIILDTSSEDNVHVYNGPGYYSTTGNITNYGSYSSIHSTTTYTPGSTIVYGSHDRGLAIKMFREGEAGSANAVSAREVLGPKWQKLVKSGVSTCLG